MKIRRQALPPGWYPRDGESVRRLVDSWSQPERSRGALSAIAPHAGWTFSGRVASAAWAALRDAETIVVVGGHLSASSPVLMAAEDAFESPFGHIRGDDELLSRIVEALADSRIGAENDLFVDNTVEVQLPFMGVYAPQSRLVWLRAPAGPGALELGRAIHSASMSLRRQVAVVGSTDLTHYGPDYGFEPVGRGPGAERWVREVNDRAFLDALAKPDPAGAINRAREDSSACSPGAAAAALVFALSAERCAIEELAYATSLDVRPAPSFVGYAALAAKA